MLLGNEEERNILMFNVLGSGKMSNPGYSAESNFGKCVSWVSEWQSKMYQPRKNVMGLKA